MCVCVCVCVPVRDLEASKSGPTYPRVGLQYKTKSDLESPEGPLGTLLHTVEKNTIIPTG